MSCYRRDLWAFPTFLAQHCGTLPSLATLCALGSSDLRAYLAERISPGAGTEFNGPRSQRDQELLPLFSSQELVSNRLIMEVRDPKAPQSVPKALSRQDALDALEGVEYVSVYAALLSLFYGCGLRLAEALSLKHSDAADAQRGQLTITGKGNKQRIVPVLPFVAEAIEDYVAVCPFHRDPLFRGFRGGPLRPRIVQDMMRRLRQYLGLPETSTLPALRHSFATHLMADGGDLRVIRSCWAMPPSRRRSAIPMWTRRCW